MKEYIKALTLEYKDAETVYKVGIWDKEIAIEKFYDRSECVLADASEDSQISGAQMDALILMRTQFVEILEN